MRVDPHPKRRGPGRPAAGHVLVIVTDMLDVPAELIAAIYRDRWMIELFFRTLKHLLGLRHLLSTDPRGITIQTYCAMIACLLIVLTTGRQPTKRTWEMLCWHFLGVASDGELLLPPEQAEGGRERSFGLRTLAPASIGRPSRSMLRRVGPHS